MELDLPNHRATRTRRPWIEVTLITGFVFSLLIGVGALAALLVSSRGEKTSLTASAFETINPEQIVPQLALAQLAGDPASALAYQAAAAGELETAKAIALTATELPGPQRLTLLMRIGDGFLANGQMSDTALLLTLARAVAVLDPTLGGSERSTALIQIAEGFFDAGEESAAQDAAVQAMRVAEQTPGLLPAHRSNLYENLRPVARKLDDPEFAQEIGELARNPYFEPAGVLVEPRLASLESAADDDAGVQAAKSVRQQAARLLADRIALTGGVDIGPETQTLAAALIREDQTRADFYRRSLNEGMALEDQYALLLDRRNWSALKLRVALKGFGLSLVPEWEQDPNLVLQELGAATANLGLIAEALANSLPDPIDQAMLRTESLLWLAQQAEIDLYPGASLDELNGRLQGGQSELTRLGSALALPAAYDQAASPPGYRIQSTR